MSDLTSTRRVKTAQPTIEDVARNAGVSRATVSRVANNSPRVSPGARSRVQSVIDAMGYVPNRAARSLMTRRSDSIGVVIPEQAALLFADPFFGRLLLGISAGLSDQGIQLVLLLAPTERDELRVERYLDSGHMDGAIIVGPHGDDPIPGRLVGRGVPIVLSGRPLHGNGISYIDADNTAGAKLAVRHLVETGRRSIATIYGTLDLAAAIDRLAGFRDALDAAGLPRDPALEAAGEFKPAVAARAMRDLLERRPGLDAVFAASDSMAAAAVGVLRDAGRRIPEDVAVVGFDDTVAATSVQPPLTTIRQPIEAMGREMAVLLLRRIADPGDAPSHVVFPTELVVRASTVNP